ncbi:tyrosine-type recombinase/integrase [Clostridium sp. FP1]|uniref:tyrosine-type recombinase/integrase n=1 Tax=Clostridium sp. FP1 TaxID=2724076 RepID=UPI0013E90B42|nr:tyrosine-type recombinase/integrase [Clostridium sp. FP1]MBZ9635601.1 tyrosine-type recombinase/integrase [Clostridium sp. FP1]
MLNYIDEFELYMKADKNSENTIKNYIPDIEKMLTFLNKDPLDIKSMDIANFINSLEAQELNAKTINRKIYAIYKYIQFLNSEYDFKINFNIKKMKMKIGMQEYGRNVLNKTDFKRIVNASIRDKNILVTTLLMTFYLTGMRVSEVLSIKIKDTNEKEIKVVGKGRKQRFVAIPDELRKLFKEYAATSIRRESKQKFLFINKTKDSRLSSWMCDYWIKRYASDTKVELKKAHCHNIRHLFCYVCINERGMTIDEVAQRVGHSDINITKIYTKRTRKQLVDDARNFKLE